MRDVARRLPRRRRACFRLHESGRIQPHRSGLCISGVRAMKRLTILLVLGVAGCGAVPATQSPEALPPDTEIEQELDQPAVRDAQDATWLVVWGTSEQWGIATAFAIDRAYLVTAAHVVEGIIEVLADPTAFVRAYQHETGEVRDIIAAWKHPAYVSTASDPTPDVGLLQATDFLPHVLELADASTLEGLEVFDEVSLCGFPGSLAWIDLWPIVPGAFHPRATCVRGVVSALRPLNPYASATPANTYLIQYDLSTSPGTSGSAVLNEDGLVIGVHIAGSTGADDYNFGIRTDLLVELINWVEYGSLPGWLMPVP